MNNEQLNENITDLQAYGPPIELPDTITQIDLQRMTGLDKSTVSRGLRGLLKRDTPAYQRILQALADLSTEGQAPASKNPLPPTEETPKQSPQSGGQVLLMAFLKISETRSAFSVVTGPSGAGKTYVIKRFLDEEGMDGPTRPEAIYLKARARMSIGDLLTRLCALLRVSRSGTCDQRLDTLMGTCSGRMLIVDEADLLVAGKRPSQVANYIEVFRELHGAGCCVVLIGLPVLSEQIARCCDTYVFRRIQFWHRLNTPSKTDLERYWLHITAGITGASAETRRVVQDALKLGLFGYLTELARHAADFDGDVGAARTLLYCPEA